MPRRPNPRALAALACTGLIVAICLAIPHAQTPAVAIDTDDIGGVVTGPRGPEAGVWVIAETHDLPVRFIKAVVTDDGGLFVVPDLPRANYSVWVRGYGLVDGPHTTSRPGQILALSATPAPNEAAAAEYYPAIYWYSMLHIPGAQEFGAQGKFPAALTQSAWLNQMKSNGCIGCHQIGQKATRTIPVAFGTFQSGAQAWQRRITSGQSGQQMTNQLLTLGPLGFQYLGDWTDRIARGELPRTRPTRPEGMERNIVVTLRGLGDDKHYLHDVITTDKRHPTVNASGRVYASPEYSTDLIPILDPTNNAQTTFRAPVRDERMPLSLGPGHAASLTAMAPSAYWGEEAIWDTRVNNHNSMLDAKGRVWLAASVRGRENPAFCKQGSTHPSARVFPIDQSLRQVAVWEPRTNTYRFVDTCFETHHPAFGYDADDTVWLSGGVKVLGWVNTKVFDATGDSQRAQGWTPFILDTNGNGRRDAWVEPGQPVDPTRDTRIDAGFYAVMPSPVDGSIWGSYRGNPGAVVRVVPGPNPSQTAITEIYNVPSPGFGVRGGDIDGNGVVWVSLASGHLGSFDRRKCRGPLRGPAATGNHCPEGWTLYKYPGPGFDGIGDNSAEASYYSWVDQHNTFGLGNNVPISTGNLNDGLIALKDGKMIVLRVPYPLGFYAKGLDGRIDNANAGWKGRGLWAAAGDRTPWLKEGGKGSTPFAAQFQLRPNPLAK